MSLLAATLLSFACAGEEDVVSGLPELGRVAWPRDLEAACAASRDSGKPVLVRFQEIPG